MLFGLVGYLISLYFLLQNLLDALGFTEQDETIGQGCSGGCAHVREVWAALRLPGGSQGGTGGSHRLGSDCQQ